MSINATGLNDISFFWALIWKRWTIVLTNPYKIKK